MRGFATSPNPYETGLRPRKFMEARMRMLRAKQALGTKDKRTSDVRKTVKITD